ncbi:serine/threonine-protein kinase pim-2-like, partial [Sinocyclocheilus anshuiensis]|uniref:serine/threonine-protein kinase pim-2-like n=1 Tax=Sinocyclocheilus anshuiensis TaxID=1608454 RepID=UPI0007B8A58C
MTACAAENPGNVKRVHEEKQTKMKKKKGIHAFFKRTWQAVNSAIFGGNKVSPDPRPGPSAVEPTDPADPQPDPSGLGPMALQDPADPLPGPSGLSSELMHVPGPSSLRPTPGATHPDEPVSFSSLYEMGQRLGIGGFGTVFKGTRKSDGQQVAIKIIPKYKEDDYIIIPGYSTPLIMEVALNLLVKKSQTNPKIVQMLDWFEEAHHHILILEYPQPCMTLKSFLKLNRRHLDENQARRFMLQAVLAAKHCMDRGVAHNDIRVDNILINTDTLQLKLIDFGCGELIEGCDDADNQYRGHVVPELYVQHKYALSETVLSLGNLLYRMVEGQSALENNPRFDSNRCSK